MNHSFAKLVHWAGTKYWMQDLLPGYLPQEYGDIHICFFGRGDDLQILRGHGIERHVYVSDINERLVLAHLGVRDLPEQVIAVLEEHRRNASKDYYLKVRDRFDPRMPLATTAADQIYLFRNSYKGIAKFAKDGRCTNINARTGFRFNPDTIRRHSCFLRNTTITAEDYAPAVLRAKAGDLVRMDPPYQGGVAVYGLRFTDEDHYRLRNVCNELHRRRAFFLLTNSDSPFVRHIYRNFCIEEIEAPRTLGRAKNGGRATATELVIRNY
jgi:DNA adenine methylase